MKCVNFLTILGEFHKYEKFTFLNPDLWRVQLYEICGAVWARVGQTRAVHITGFQISEIQDSESWISDWCISEILILIFTYLKFILLKFGVLNPEFQKYGNSFSWKSPVFYRGPETSLFLTFLCVIIEYNMVFCVINIAKSLIISICEEIHMDVAFFVGFEKPNIVPISASLEFNI